MDAGFQGIIIREFKAMPKAKTKRAARGGSS